jgi:HK97 family phage major capsid protein
MSALVETLKKQLDESRAEATAGWAAFETYRKENGDDKIAKDSELFDEAHRLHGVYGEAAQKAKEIEERMFQALAMDGEGPKGLSDEPTPPSSKGRMEEIHDLLGMTLGEKMADAVAESDSYKAFAADLSKQSMAVQSGTMFQTENAIDRKGLKTLLTGLSSTQGGAFVVNDRQGGVVEEFARIPNVMTRLVNIGSTDSDTVEWVAMTGVTNNAAETLEAVDADKAAGAAASSAPESALAFAIRTTIVEEIKHFIPATKRSLADAGQLRTIIDAELLLGLQDRLDGQLLNGNGTTPNLRGILNTSGIQTQAKGADPTVDAVHKAFTKLILAGFNNLTALLHPNDWQEVRLSKDASGQYYFSQRIAEGTGLAGDFGRGATLWLREGSSIAATDSHSDWFTKGIIAILASMRAAFAVKQPLAFCTVTGI